MASGNLFLSDQNAHSLRQAIVEDDGEVAYLYLTAPQVTKIAASAWIYRRASFPVIPRPWPSAEGSGGSVFEACRDPAARDWVFLWSHDGHSVAALADGYPMACIIDATNPGYSRGLTAPTSFGNTWDEAIYARVFGRV